MKQKDIAIGWRYLDKTTDEIRRVDGIVEGQVHYWIDGVPSPVPHAASLKDFAAWADERIADDAPWIIGEEKPE